MIRWVSIAVILGSLMLLFRALPAAELQQALQSWINGMGVWGPVVFAAIYVVATVCFLPGSVFTLAAGAIFGLGIGFVTALVGANIGAALAFLIARYLARSRVEELARANRTFGAVDEAISEGGWKIVALLRLSPAIPFNWQNYLYGLTSIRFWPCVITSLFAMMPGAFLYVYLGHVAGVAASASGETSVARWVLLGVGLLATIVVTIYITRLAKQKLASRTEIADEETDGGEAESEEKTSPGSSYGYAIIAAVMLGLAIYAQFQSERIAEWIRPLL